MAERTARATWNGALQGGSGDLELGSGAWEGPFDFRSRFEEGDTTNPEELIGAAHAGCFSMAFAGELGRAGYDPEEIQTEVSVYLEQGDDGWSITRSHLDTVVEVEDVGEEEFQELAETAKENCPVSRALAGVEKTMTAKLK